MKTLVLGLVTPEKQVLERTVRFVVLPAWEGEMGVLPGHAPYLAALRAGEVRVTDEEGRVSRLAISGGFAEITSTAVSLFAETAEIAQEIDAERARQAEEKAQFELQRKDMDPLTLAAAEAALRRARIRLKVSRSQRHPPAAH